MLRHFRFLYKIAYHNQYSSSRKISVTSFYLHPRIISPNIREEKNAAEQKTNDDISFVKSEVETLNEIEINLFENSDNKHEPLKEKTKTFLNKYKTEKQVKKPKKTVEVTEKIKKKEYSSRVVEDNELNLTYTRLDLNHPLLSKLLLAVRSRKHRVKNQLILLEGRRLFLEAMECGLQLKTVIFSQKDEIALISQKLSKYISKDVVIYKVPQHDLKIWSALSTPPGVIGIFTRPTNEEIRLNIMKHTEKSQNIPVTVVCNNIREPNNLGSIIRTAAALPCAEVVILKGCCDPWESKALRGGCGGHFRVVLKDDVIWENFVSELPQDSSIFISENNLNRIHQYGFDKKTQIYSDLNMKNNNTNYYVIIGGETHGISDDIYKSISPNKLDATFLHIPLGNGVESLNTTSALALLLFELRKKYLHSFNIKDNEFKINSY